MSEILKTILVDGPNGKYRINESDYNEEIHGKIGKNADAGEQSSEAGVNATVVPAPGVLVQPAPSAVNAPSPATDSLVPPTTVPAQQRLVLPKGNKFIVVTADGTPVEAEGIEKKGYATESEAWAAAMATPVVPVPNA